MRRVSSETLCSSVAQLISALFGRQGRDVHSEVVDELLERAYRRSANSNRAFENLCVEGGGQHK